MFCLMSFMFVFIVIAQLEAGDISVGQAIMYGFYGIFMCYYTSIPYWTECKKNKQKNK